MLGHLLFRSDSSPASAFTRFLPSPPPIHVHAPPRCRVWLQEDDNSKLSVVHEEVVRSIPTVRSVALKKARKEDASGIIGALIPQDPSTWRVVPNLVSLLLSDLSADSSTGGAHPIRTIGQAIEVFNQLPALQELVFLNCQALEADMTPLANGLKKGNAPQLRVFNYGNDQQRGTQESSTNLLLGALASGVCSRPRVQVLSFADNWSFVDTSLTHLRAALQACSGLRKLNIDSSKRPIFEVLDLAYAIAAGELPQLEYVCLTVPVVAPKDEPWKAIEILTRTAASKTPPVVLEARLA